MPILKTLGGFENLVFVIMSAREKIRLIARSPFIASEYLDTVKHVLRGHSKKDKTKDLKTDGSLMQVESIAEFCNTFGLH